MDCKCALVAIVVAVVDIRDCCWNSRDCEGGQRTREDSNPGIEQGEEMDEGHLRIFGSWNGKERGSENVWKEDFFLKSRETTH